MKASQKKIDRFFASKNIAIAGVSRNPKKFGYTLFAELRKRGYNITPVNPNTEEIDGVRCFRRVADLPEKTSRLIICTAQKQTDEVLLEAIQKGIRHIWIQQKSDTPQTASIIKDHSTDILTGRCALMFAEPVSGIHKFHRAILKIFGQIPSK